MVQLLISSAAEKQPLAAEEGTRQFTLMHSVIQEATGGISAAFPTRHCTLSCLLI